MPLVLPEVLDLATVAGIFVLIGLLLAAKYLVDGIASGIDVEIPYIHARPFHGIAVALRNDVLGAIESGIGHLESAADGLLTGLKDAFREMVALTDDLLAGVKSGFGYLWSHGIDSKILYRFVQAMPGIGTAAALYEFVRQAAHKLNLTDVLHATRIAESAAASAYDSSTALAKTYADIVADNAASTAKRFALDAEARAESYADAAVSKLRDAETIAVNKALDIANAAKDAVLAAERTAAADLTIAETKAAAALAAAQAAGAEALSAVKSVAVTAEDDVLGVLGKLSPADAATLIASVPAIGTLLYAISTEAGLSNAECRSKVKGICGTDPAKWGNLLAGLAAVGLAFDLRELVKLCESVAGEAVALVKQAA